MNEGLKKNSSALFLAIYNPYFRCSTTSQRLYKQSQREQNIGTEM